MKNDTFYFSHDFNARNDIKIKKLLSKHGYLGYGVFWAIVEELYNNANALPTDYDCIAFDLRTDKPLVESVVSDFELFVIEDGKFGSMSIQRRLDERNEKSNNARNSANKRWKNADAMPPHTERTATALPPQSEGNAIKERKGKESVEGSNKIKKGLFVPPTIDEVVKYFLEKGYTELSARKAFNYYDAGNWSDSKGNKVKSWKQKMQGVWFKEENMIPIKTNEVVHVSHQPLNY